MPFSISFLDTDYLYPYDNPDTPAASGLLTIGDHREGFYSSLYEWSKQSYEDQWRQALKTLIDGRSKKTALIVEYVSPAAATQLEWWAMYREDENVYLQNQLLFYSQLTEPFDLERPFQFLRDRQAINEDGRAISEWCVSLSDVKEFASTFGVFSSS